MSKLLYSVQTRDPKLHKNSMLFNFSQNKWEAAHINANHLTTSQKVAEMQALKTPTKCLIQEYDLKLNRMYEVFISRESKV